MRRVLVVLISCACLLVVAGCNRPQTEEKPKPPEGVAAPTPEAKPEAKPQDAEEDESIPAEETETTPPPQAVTPAPAPPAAQAAQFVGPLEGKSFVRTRIFGDYKPTASVFMGERDNRYGRPYYHQGVDVLAPVGTELIAPDDGEVVMSGMWHPSGYGRVTLIRVRAASGEVYALYAHLSRTLVRKGAHVRRGQVVALSGKSGNAAALPEPEAHVHVEVWSQQKVGRALSGRLDPLKYFPEILVPQHGP